MKIQNYLEKTLDIILWVMLGLFALFVLKNPQVASNGVMNGLHVCIYQLIPSLFPFMVISNFIIKTNIHKKIGKIMSKPFKKLFKIGENASGIVILSFFTGFPVGASMANDLYRRKECTKNEAERLMGFCNNASIVFCLAVLGSGILKDVRLGIFIYICHIISAMIVGIISSKNKKTDFLVKEIYIEKNNMSSMTALVKSITESALSMFYVCAFVTFFFAFLNMVDYLSVTSYLNRYFSFSPQVLNCINSVLFGLVEITNGINMIKSVSPLSIACAGFILSFSGFCILCQCSNFAYDSKLSMKQYLKSKVLQSVITFILCYLISMIFIF